MGRLLGPHLGVTILIAAGVVIVVWLALAASSEPRVQLVGYVFIDTADSKACVHIQTADSPPIVWNVIGLPPGYSVSLETFDPRSTVDDGRITGPDFSAGYFDPVSVQGVPMPAASADPCGFHRRVQALTLTQWGFGP
jgi:hypothetical protein